jgi:hypothetical protein
MYPLIEQFCTTQSRCNEHCTEPYRVHTKDLMNITGGRERTARIRKKLQKEKGAFISKSSAPAPASNPNRHWPSWFNNKQEGWLSKVMGAFMSYGFLRLRMRLLMFIEMVETCDDCLIILAKCLSH